MHPNVDEIVEQVTLLLKRIARSQPVGIISNIKNFKVHNSLENPILFSIGGICDSLRAGAGIGGLLFSKAGQSLMVKLGI
jgi:hypothetical protein